MLPAIIWIRRSIIRCFRRSSSQYVLWLLQHCRRLSIFIWIGIVAPLVVGAVWVLSAVLIMWVDHIPVLHAKWVVARVYLAIGLWLFVLSMIFYYLLLFCFEFFVGLVTDVLKGCFTSGYTFIRMRYLTVRQISIHLLIVRHQTRFLLILNIDLIGALPKVEEVFLLDIWFHFIVQLLWSGVFS